MANNVESELKFVFAPEYLGVVQAALREETKGQAARRRLVSHYFDTDDDYLWRHAVTLRVRQEGEQSVQTIKRQKASALDRDEFEAQTEGDAPNLKAIRRSPMARLFRKTKVRDHLRGNLDVDVERETSAIELHGSEVEAALDTGQIRSDGRALQFSELELELKSGERKILFELARTLCVDTPIALSLISKAERGHLLAKDAWGRSFKGRQPKIAKRMNCAEAFQTICHACLHDFTLNTQALKGDDRVEAVHQGRIALRRLRAALQLFRPIVHDPEYQRLDDELKWMAHVFGDARDLDVFQESFSKGEARTDDSPSARELADLTDAKRNEAHDRVNKGVDSARLRLLLVDLTEWIENGFWRTNESRWREPIARFARRALKKRLGKFVKRARNLAELDPAAQHKVRIRAKKLRYMAGFFKTAPKLVSRRRALAKLLDRLEQMQNCLGEIHDEQARAAFLIDEVRHLPSGADPMIAFAAGRIARSAAGDDKRLAIAAKAYQDLAASSPF